MISQLSNKEAYFKEAAWADLSFSCPNLGRLQANAYGNWYYCWYYEIPTGHCHAHER